MILSDFCWDDLPEQDARIDTKRTQDNMMIVGWKQGRSILIFFIIIILLRMANQEDVLPRPSATPSKGGQHCGTQAESQIPVRHRVPLWRGWPKAGGG